MGIYGHSKKPYVPKGKDSRLFSFDYHKLDIFNKKKKLKTDMWHYHIEDPSYHYVFKSNWQYSKGYRFTSKNYIWVW